MKVQPICASCLLYRGVQELKRATSDKRVLQEGIRKIAELIAVRFSFDLPPAVLGTERDRLIKKITKNPDPYREEKKRANEAVLKILPKLFEYIESSNSKKDRFFKASYLAALGNFIEYDVLGYSFDEQLRDLFQRKVQLSIDDREKAFKIIEKLEGSTLIYLTDNAGEIVFDIPLLAVLREDLGVYVILSPKSAPILNDATVDDVYEVGADQYVDQVVGVGSDVVGLNLDEASPEFLQYWQRAEFVIAKGMGHFEMLTEYPPKPPVLHIMALKCEPVARAVGGAKGALAVCLRI
ncbi:DUF89 family protein [archaeon]|nr:DUF89 family protein [archaeon]